MSNIKQRQPVKLTQGYIREMITRTIEKDKNLDKIIEEKVRASVNKVLVEHGVIKPKKKTREDVLLEKLNEVEKLRQQIISELGTGSSKQISGMINEEYDEASDTDDDEAAMEHAESEIEKRIAIMESQDHLSESERINLQILKETRGATSSVDYRNAVDRVPVHRAVPTVRVGKQPSPEQIAQSMYSNGMIGDPEEAIDQYVSTSNNAGEPQQVDPMERLSRMNISDEDVVVGPVFAAPKDIERR